MLFPRLFGSDKNQQNSSPVLPNTMNMDHPPPPAFHDFGSITLAPPAPLPTQPRTHHELPRLQIPPLSLLQPTQPSQPQLHWKSAAVEQPPPPVSRMRMVANFFSSEARQQQQQQILQSPPPSGGMLPSFSEILARTKQLYINPSPPMEVMADEAMEQAEELIEHNNQNQLPSEPLQPDYSAARYALQPPMTIDVSTIDYEEDQNQTQHQLGMYTPSSPSGSMSPMSQSGKSSKRRERWTEDEHARFMEGLNRYGRKWKKIQAFVKTKTAVQVRTHAYGYFAKLLRNMPEDDAAWELAEEMSSLPGAVLKGPSSGKRRSEPKTDEAGMDILRRFVFSKKKTDPKNEVETMETAQMWGTQEGWNMMESQASSVMLDLKRQRIN